MKLSIDGLTLSTYETKLVRICSDCSRAYSILDYAGGGRDHYFYRPTNYKNGCERHCLECWLGVSEPLDTPPETNESIGVETPCPEIHQHWYDEKNYRSIDQGDLCKAYKKYFQEDCHLAILPLSRLVTDRSVFLPYGVMIYPQGRLNLASIHVDNKQLTKVAYSQISASNVRLGQLDKHPLLVIPLKFSWEELKRGSHSAHLEMIARISEITDSLCFDVINYQNCKLEHLACETKPANAGQLMSNSMMSAALLVKSDAMNSVLLAGAAFTHVTTKGLGLDLRQPEWDRFPQYGEVGKIAAHGLSLYSQMLQTQSATSKFVQALSLIEFLACPDDFMKFQDIKKVVSKYVTNCPKEHERLMDRFRELTGKKDETTKQEVGLRTNIVHIGARLEQLIKSRSERENLFRELDGYVRAMLDHMIEHDYMSSEEYETLKKSM
ncbi:hypothetical protein PHLH6_28590 [Pseudomonas sp. Seg1]|uniref:hypothetical protein n=1 Tax=Pseudomonas sp. Seg1 TaxID=2678259 RepID=UPI001BB3503A|nr:hypothetical protein [Pseudomonas sp. Seg1]BBP70855.1 hypothetical protein PHLH6_28590 [Pseudomonas sp. Seg1]